MNLREISENLVEMARARMSSDESTPFSEEISRKTGHSWVGGKRDDITVVVSYVDDA